MPGYAQLGEVRTYYEEDGRGPPLVLLHPGGADSRVFEEVVAELAGGFAVFRPDRGGHGRTRDVEGPIGYELMARDTIAFLEEVVGGPAFLVGHSDGRWWRWWWRCGGPTWCGGWCSRRGCSTTRAGRRG